jgi:hypothetical protein
MKTLVGMLIALSFATPAFAVTDGELIAKQYEARHFCRIPEDAPSIKASERACEESRSLAKTLTVKGYCYTVSEQEWVKCNLPRLQIRQ